MTTTVTRRFPNFVSGGERTKSTFEDAEGMFKIDWINEITKVNGFKRFAISAVGYPYPKNRAYDLMVLYDDGKFWVVGNMDRDPGFLADYEDDG